MSCYLVDPEKIIDIARNISNCYKDLLPYEFNQLSSKEKELRLIKKFLACNIESFAMRYSHIPEIQKEIEEYQKEFTKCYKHYSVPAHKWLMHIYIDLSELYYQCTEQHKETEGEYELIESLLFMTSRRLVEMSDHYKQAIDIA